MKTRKRAISYSKDHSALKMTDTSTQMLFVGETLTTYQNATMN